MKALRTIGLSAAAIVALALAASLKPVAQAIWEKYR